MGDDDFMFEDQARVTGNIDGQGGSNTLDFSAFAVPPTVVYFNPADRTAGLVTTIGGAFYNIQDLINVQEGAPPGRGGSGGFRAPDLSGVGEGPEGLPVEGPALGAGAGVSEGRAASRLIPGPVAVAPLPGGTTPGETGTSADPFRAGHHPVVRQDPDAFFFLDALSPAAIAEFAGTA